jgi:hypothetical protein
VLLLPWPAGRASREEDDREEEDMKKKETWGQKGKSLFYNFCLQALFCASYFPTRKHEFGELNFGFSVHVFTGSVRDALRAMAVLGCSISVSRILVWVWLLAGMV